MKREAVSAPTGTRPAERLQSGRQATRKSPSAIEADWLLRGRGVLLFFLGLLAVLFTLHLLVVLAPAPQETAAGQDPDGQPAGAFLLLKDYQIRVLTFTAGVYLVFALSGIMVIRRLLLPALRIRETARQIADGNLQSLVSSRDEASLGNLGAMINDIAMNLQEILMLAWNNAHKNAATAERIADACAGDNSEASGELRGIAENLRTMEILVQEYDFYHVQLEGGSVVDPEADQSVGKRS